MRHAASHIGSLQAVGQLLAPGPRGRGVRRRIRGARSAGSGPAEAAESVQRALPQAHPCELDRWTSGLRKALAEGVALGARLIEPRFEVSPMSREHHDMHDGEKEEGDRCQDGQVTRGCFHERLPGTTTGMTPRGTRMDCHDRPRCQYAPPIR